MRHRSRLHIAALLLLAQLKCAAAIATPCESELVMFAIDDGELRVSDAIVFAVEKLDLPRDELSKLAADLALSNDGLTMSHGFLKSHTDHTWLRVENILRVVRLQLTRFGSSKRKIVVDTLRQKWLTLAEREALSVRTQQDIFDKWQILHGYRTLNQYLLIGIPNHFTALHLLENDPTKLLISRGSFEHMLLDFSDGEHPHEITIPQFSWPDAGKDLGPLLFYAMTSGSNASPKDIFAYDFSNIKNPVALSLREAMIESGLMEHLHQGGHLMNAYQVSSDQFLLNAGQTSERNDAKLYGLNIKSGVIKLLNLDQQSQMLISRFVKVGQHKALGFGVSGQVATFDFSSPNWMNDFSVQWSDHAYKLSDDPQRRTKLEGTYSGAKLLSTGSVVSWGVGSNTLVMWEVADRGPAVPTTLAARSIGEASPITQVFEIAPHKLLSVNSAGTGVFWDVSDPKDFDAKHSEVMFPEVGSEDHILQLVEGGVLSFRRNDKWRGKLSLCKLNDAGKIDTKTIELDINEEFDGPSLLLEMKMVQTIDGDVVIFANSGTIVYVTLGKNLRVAHLKFAMGNPLQSQNAKEVVTLPTGNLVVMATNGLLVELSTKALKKLAGAQP